MTRPHSFNPNFLIPSEAHDFTSRTLSGFAQRGGHEHPLWTRLNVWSLIGAGPQWPLIQVGETAQGIGICVLPSVTSLSLLTRAMRLRGRVVWLRRQPLSFDLLSPGDVYAVALGLNPDFVREFLCDRKSHTASRSLFLHLGHHHNSTTLECLCI